MIDWSKEQIRKTAAQLKADNPLLTSGQLAFESDTQKGKVGPGYFNSLPYEGQVDVVEANRAWDADLRDDDGNGSSGDTFTPFIYLTSGSTTAAYRKQGTLNGKDWYVKVGSTATEASLVDSVVWDDPGSGDQWNVTNASADVLYSSTEDVATPDLVETWVADGGTGALPSVAYYGETSQEGMEALAKGAAVGNTVFVDAVAGDDDTGARGRADRPFATCEAARDAAVSGDTIEVRPGLYDEYNLVKDGVNYYFHPGARIIYTGTPDPGEAQAIFGAQEAATVSSFGVYGNGHFEWAAGGVGYVMYWQASNSVVRLYADSVASDGTDLLGMDTGVGCDIYMEAKKGTTANDAMYASPGGSGTVIIRIDEVEAGAALMIIEGSGGYVRLIFNNATCDRIGVITSNDVSIDGRYVLHSGTSAGLSMEGGTCKINQCVIEAEDEDAKSIDYLGGDLTLYGCTLMSGSAADSITADSARTVIAATACTTYRPIGANVTVRGNMQYDTGAAGVGKQPIAAADGTWSWR